MNVYKAHGNAYLKGGCDNIIPTSIGEFYGMLGSRACSEVFHQSDFLSTSRRARPKPCHMLKPGFCRGKEVNIRSILMLRFIYLFKKNRVTWGKEETYSEREGGREQEKTFHLLVHLLQQPGLGQTDGKSQELYPHFLHGCRNART